MRKLVLLVILAMLLPLQGCGLLCGLCALQQMLRDLPPPADGADKAKEP